MTGRLRVQGLGDEAKAKQRTNASKKVEPAAPLRLASRSRSLHPRPRSLCRPHSCPVVKDHGVYGSGFEV
jgi:hypothetical protein